jgi:DNA-binding MarR family transcriptional regulator
MSIEQEQLARKRQKMKDIFNSHFTLLILSKLHQCYRPSQIAEQLGVTPQGIHYHTDRMVGAQLICKDASSGGIKWKLTEKGKSILKQKLTGSVNSFNNYQTRPIPIRLDNLTFEFRILSSIPTNLVLRWNELNNGVSKCSMKYDTSTIEIIRSEKAAVMLIHVEKKYCFDWTRELITEYNLALHYARQVATKLSIQISDYGRMIKRPHIAFERDLIACYSAASYTADIKTRQGEGEGEGKDEYRAWIDSSNGTGELETNDDEYCYDYPMMPKTVRKIANMTLAVIIQTSGYERCYHPLFTGNN